MQKKEKIRGIKKFLIETMENFAVDNCCDTKFGLTDEAQGCPFAEECRFYEDEKHPCLIVKNLKRRDLK